VLTKFAHVESRLSGRKRQREAVFYAPVNLCGRRACSASVAVGLKAKIAAALYHENGKVPTPEEIEKWTKFAKVLYTAVLGLHFEREQQKKDGQLAIF
jgi:hypothetical protein